MNQAFVGTAETAPGGASVQQEPSATTTRELRRKLRTGALAPAAKAAAGPSGHVRVVKRQPSAKSHIFWTAVFVLSVNLVTAFGIAVAAGPGRLKATLLAGVPYMVVATLFVCALSASAWVHRHHDSD